MTAALRNLAVWLICVLLLLVVFTLFQEPRQLFQDFTARQPQDTVQWFVSLFVSWLPFIVLIGVWLFLSRRMQRAGGTALGFGKGAAMSNKVLADPKHWRDRAEEARALAGQMADHDSKRRMVEIAKGYEYLAHRAEERLRGSEKSQ
jgi:hypothetical protein